MASSSEEPVGTLERLRRELRCDEDATELFNAWQLLRACGAVQWQLDLPDFSSVRLRATGIGEVNMSVYRTMVSQCAQLQRVCVQWIDEDLVVDVHIWNHTFYTDSPHIAVPPINAFPGVQLATDMVLPPSCSRHERRTLKRIVSKMTAVQKHPPQLEATLQNDRDGLRFVLTLAGYTYLQLEALNGMHRAEPQLQDIVVCKAPALNVRLTILRDAAKELEEKKGVKRARRSTDLVYNRPHVE
jgi:hypothetical protein